MMKILIAFLIVAGALLTYLSKQIVKLLWAESVDAADEKNIYIKLAGLVLIVVAVLITALA